VILAILVAYSVLIKANFVLNVKRDSSITITNVWSGVQTVTSNLNKTNSKFVQNAILNAKPVMKVPRTVSPAILENISFKENVKIVTLSVALAMAPSPPIVAPVNMGGI
jgi:hypothetical protein